MLEVIQPVFGGMMKEMYLVDGVWMFLADKFDSILGVCDYQVGILGNKLCQKPFEGSISLDMRLFVVQYPDDFPSAQLDDDKEEDGYDGLDQAVFEVGNAFKPVEDEGIAPMLGGQDA